MRKKQFWGLLFTLSILTPILLLRAIAHYEPADVQAWIQKWGFWSPLLYIILYVVATLLILPSTALNLSAGALFGPWQGTLWASLGAILAAIAAFAFTRTWGQRWTQRRFQATWQSLNREIQQGGVSYMFAIRLLPIIPYGIVNFAAGLTSISFRDYLTGTLLGTVPGILPFVWLGSSGFKALSTGEWLPVAIALTLAGGLVLGATWYRRRSQSR
jgi:uncharacterized membrane protein YdjX (TVP38/TMEM64 family)